MERNRVRGEGYGLLPGTLRVIGCENLRRLNGNGQRARCRPAIRFGSECAERYYPASGFERLNRLSAFPGSFRSPVFV